jgi:putative heme-binding domain-containing protein
VPLDRQERLDNLIFPRGSGPGVLAGRGGGPNAANGEGTFRTACASCHKFNGAGEGYGPDLTTIGTTLQRREILRAIFFPNEKVDPKYHTTVVATRDGKTVRGLLVSETAQAVTLKPSDAPTVTIEKGQIASRRTEAMSIMPDDLIDKIGGDANIANVVAYLMGGR